MDEQYRSAYERLRVQTERYERGIREQELLKKVINFIGLNQWLLNFRN